jgi:hypothetical protein
MTTVAARSRKKEWESGSTNIAWQTDSYIIGKEKEAWFTPDFTIIHTDILKSQD